MAQQLDPIQQAALAGMRGGGTTFQREMKGDIRSIRLSDDGSCLTIAASEGKGRSVGVWLICVSTLFLGMGVAAYIATKGHPATVFLFSVCFAAFATMGFAVVFLGITKAHLIKRGNEVLLKIGRKPAHPLPEPVKCVQAYGPLTNVSQGKAAATSLAVATVTSILAMPFGVAVIPGGAEVGPVPQIHVVLEGLGRIRFQHGADQRRILLRGAEIAKFLGVSLEDRTRAVQENSR